MHASVLFIENFVMQEKYLFVQNPSANHTSHSNAARLSVASSISFSSLVIDKPFYSFNKCVVSKMDALYFSSV